MTDRVSCPACTICHNCSGMGSRPIGSAYQCPACRGTGRSRRDLIGDAIEWDAMPEEYVGCDVCHGSHRTSPEDAAAYTLRMI